MTTDSKIIVTETIGGQDSGNIKSPILNGFFLSKFRENMLVDDSERTVDHILANSYQSIGYFRDPHCSEKSLLQVPVRILCLGKVQSGKTSFFLGSIALAFDNGYDIAYILGGTKLRLKKQNLGRVEEAFQNNKDKVKVIDVTRGFKDDLRDLIAKGFKLILVILKNPAKKTNLGQLAKYSEEYQDIPALIVDDEGDEFTPGNPKSKTKTGGKTHDKIGEIITKFTRCTFLTVTATPQANLLVSTFDVVSPDRLVLVQPGDGYTGGTEFFDDSTNPHVVVIGDSDDFQESIPDTFKDALWFFLFSCALKLSQGDSDPFSMLVHPSSFNAIQDIVAARIKQYFEEAIQSAFANPGSMEWDSAVDCLKDAFNDYCTKNNAPTVSFEQILKSVPEVLKGFKIQIINYTAGDYGDETKKGEKPLFPYKVKVGGNMLGRGLTIDRLIVSYIYRDSKEPAVDTMYQRCRWFGYKQSYFDICRVYMTQQIQEKFIAIVSHETHMWATMDAFLNTQINIKKLKRVFQLNNQDLILTRRTVSNTVVLKVIASGNRPDECIDISDEDKRNNRIVFDTFLSKHQSQGKLVDFDNSPDHRQRHLLLDLPYSTLFDDFLSKIKFADESKFDINVFSNLLSLVKNGNREDKILVMVMRPETFEVRSPQDDTMMNISRLLQGRNDKTAFTGDIYPVDISGKEYKNTPFIQIHLIRLSESVPKSEAFPLISFNNPFTASTIQMVTGDNSYDN
jgi:hypothetical protein